MPTAEEVAIQLGDEFLRRGNFTAATGPITVMAAAAAEEAFEFLDPEAFGDIEVQAVGHEEGVEDPRVYIYLTRGSRKLIDSLPKEVGGIPIVAHRMGAITVRPESAAKATNRGHLFERAGRVCCGSSCGPSAASWVGTLGALVQPRDGGDIFLLSNNHVLAGCNHIPKHQPIMSPGSGDSRAGISAPREIGRHDQIEEMRSGNPDFVTPCDADLALARATNPRIISSWQGDVDGYDTPNTVTVPTSRMRVRKFGRTTAHTVGTVESKSPVPTPIAYNSKEFKGTIWFKGIWSVRSDPGQLFALGGDSGSLVVTEDAQAAVGVVFAANKSGDYGLIIPMPQVTGSFGGLQLLSNHGIQ